MKKKLLSMLLVVAMVICLVPMTTGVASAATSKKALIYQFSVSSDPSLTNWSKKIADQARTNLRKLGYTCDTIMCGGVKMTGNNGISASEELNRMAQYDVVLFTCHGYADKWTPGRIDLYMNLYITPNAVQNWSGSLSKNKLIFIACCDAGRKVNGTSVADKFKAKGAKAIVCYTDSLAPAFALDMTTLFFSRFAAVGADSAYQMQQYYNYMYNALNNLWPNHPYSMAALRFIR